MSAFQRLWHFNKRMSPEVGVVASYHLESEHKIVYAHVAGSIDGSNIEQVPIGVLKERSSIEFTGFSIIIISHIKKIRI
jgi:hypothetical protein